MNQRRAGGFTLLEICLVVAIAGILLAVGIPSFVSWRAGNDLRAAADTLVSDIKLAESQAPQFGLMPVFSEPSIPETGAATENGPGYIPPVTGTGNDGSATVYRVLLYQGGSAGWKELRRGVVNDAIQMTVLPAGLNLSDTSVLQQSSTAVAIGSNGGPLSGLAFAPNGSLVSAQPLTVQLSSSGRTLTVTVPITGSVTVQD